MSFLGSIKLFINSQFINIAIETLHSIAWQSSLDFFEKFSLEKVWNNLLTGLATSFEGSVPQNYLYLYIVAQGCSMCESAHFLFHPVIIVLA